jgi:hypothetical protein
LNTTYRLLTGLVTGSTDVDKRHPPKRGMAMHNGDRGCLDAIVVDEALAGEVNILLEITKKLSKWSLIPGWVHVLKAINAPGGDSN